jgi:hypothetical protein
LQYDNGVFRQSDRPLEEKEFPDEIDLAEGDEDSPLTLRHCPACDELVYDQTQQCPHCKEWIFLDSQDWRSSKKWYVRGGLYITKTLLLNWFFWLAVAAIVSIISLLEIFGWLNPLD